MTRPRIEPALLAALAERVPARVAKKLDGAPEVANAWSWSAEAVETDGGETVTLAARDGVLGDADQLACTCLLAPRCFHILAVASVLELEARGDDAPGVADGDDALTADDGRTEERRPGALGTSVLAGQRAAAGLALRVVEELLRAGAGAAGSVLQGELLRLVHEARLEGAHRISSAALRVVRGVRALRSESASFATAELVSDLGTLVGSAHLLVSRSEVPAGVLGVARRTYQPRGHLRLSGLLTEPVVARGGYAGVTTWVIDERGIIYTISDVLPASPSRALGAYDLAVALGDTTISHRELARASLFVQNATASDDRRLGAGRDVKAVRASGSASWGEGGAALRFHEPVEEQLARAFAALDDGDEQAGTRAALFIEGELVGMDRDALVLQHPAWGHVHLVAKTDHEELRYAENLRMLSRAGGTRVRVIGELVPDSPRTIAALAIAAPDGALPLAEALAGRINLGLDRLTAGDLGGLSPKEAPRAVDTRRHDPLLPLRRWLERIALHGVRSMPTEAGPRVDAERAALERAMLEHASHALAALHAGVLASARGAPSLARAFLAAHVYERTATRALQRAAFPAAS